MLCVYNVACDCMLTQTRWCASLLLPKPRIRRGRLTRLDSCFVRQCDSLLLRTYASRVYCPLYGTSPSCISIPAARVSRRIAQKTQELQQIYMHIKNTQ